MIKVRAPTGVLSQQELMSNAAPVGLIGNHLFCPGVGATPAGHTISRQVTMAESSMHSDSSVLAAAVHAGKRADLFPGVSFGLVSDGDDLIPVERGLLRAPAGNSFWDMVLSPGKLWCQSGDVGVSRAVLPFQLCNVLENDTHHGLFTFVFDHESVSAFRYQIVTETKPFLVSDSFDAWGAVPVSTSALDAAGAHVAKQSFDRERQTWLALEPWSNLGECAPEAILRSVDEGFGADSAVVSGLVVDGTIYATACRTRMGAYPLPRAMKFGIWSATKTAFGTIAFLRLAQSLGEDCRGAPIAELLPQAAGLERWAGVTIGDCLNMATGIGTAAPVSQPPDIFADYLLTDEQAGESEPARQSFEHYFEWFLAPDQDAKNTSAISCPGYPWRPGEVVRYRDQDLYLAGAAMDAWLKQRCGPDKRLWDVVRDEVYEPCGIHHAVKFHTIETDPARSVPLTDAGLLLGLDDVARLGRLIHDGGRLAGQPVLQPELLAEVFDARQSKGLPTGTYTDDGEILYHAATWHLPYVAQSGERFWLPTMRGYGGQTIQVLPNGMTAFRFAHDSYETDERYDGLRLARIADAIRPF